MTEINVQIAVQITDDPDLPYAVTVGDGRNESTFQATTHTDITGNATGQAFSYLEAEFARLRRETHDE